MGQDFQSSDIYINYQKNVKDIYQVSWQIAITIFIQATLTAIITETFYKLFIRHYLQKWLVRRWVKKKNKDYCGTIMGQLQFATGSDNGSTLYSLPFQQLCGQIENALRNQLDCGDIHLVEIFASNAASEDLEKFACKKNLQRFSEEEQTEIMLAEERVSYYLERGLDDLQITLAKNWLIIDYLFSIFISSFILEFLLTPATILGVGNTADQAVLNVLISLISGFLAPTIRDFPHKIINKK